MVSDELEKAINEFGETPFPGWPTSNKRAALVAAIEREVAERGSDVQGMGPIGAGSGAEKDRGGLGIEDRAMTTGDAERLLLLRGSAEQFADDDLIFHVDEMKMVLRLLDRFADRIVEIEAERDRLAAALATSEKTADEYFRLIEDRGIAMTRNQSAIERLAAALAQAEARNVELQRENEERRITYQERLNS